MSTLNYEAIRQKLEQAPSDQRDDILRDEIEIEIECKSHDLNGSLLGHGLSDVTLQTDSIEAAVLITMVGEAECDEDGEFQDEDGEGYSQSETEHYFGVTLSEDKIAWTEL